MRTHQRPAWLAVLALAAMLLVLPSTSPAFDHGPGGDGPNLPTYSSDSDIDEPFDRQIADGRPSAFSKPIRSEIRPAKPATRPVWSGWLRLLVRLTTLGYLR